MHTSHTSISFGLWVRQRRKALGLTQEDLARQVGCSTVTVRKLEADERRPSEQMAERLARYLEIAPQEHQAFLRAARVDDSLVRPAPANPHVPADVPHNLPARLPTLVGRQHLLAAARNRLLRPEVRLLTLTGLGGVGKTSLALQIAAAELGNFPDGVFFIALATVDQDAQVLVAVAQTLDIPETDGQPVYERLCAYLAARRMLLVLDNMEQVAGAGARVAELVRACPALKVLITSRVPLRVDGEHTLKVPPLPVPNPTDYLDVQALLSYPAAELFVLRASEVRQDFMATPADADAIGEICARLDGLPLAIELVAARSNVLEPPALLQRLKGAHGYAPLQLPRGSASQRPLRHQTLRNAIDWSFNLLDARQQQLFTRLGVFSGGFTLAAAESVCAGDQLRPIDVLDGLQALLDAHLVVRQASVDREFRFNLLMTIREYALEQLAARGALDTTRANHAAYYLELAIEADRQLEGADQEHWIARLEREHDNLRAALQWALNAAALETAARLGGALWWFWLLRGYWREGFSWLDLILRRCEQRGVALAPSLHADLLKGAATLAKEQGDYDRAELLYNQGLALFRSIEDQRGIASTLNNLGGLLHRRRDIDAAMGCYQESLALLRVLGLLPNVALVLANLAGLSQEAGRFEEARAYHEESLGLWRSLSNPKGLANTLINLGELALFQRDVVQAASYYAEGLALHRSRDDKQGCAAALNGLAMAAFSQGDTAQAIRSNQESLRLYYELGDKYGITSCLEVFAHALGALGALEAAHMYGLAARMRADLNTPLSDAYRLLYDEALAAAARHHDPLVWSAAWEFGRATALDQALSYALALPAGG